MVSRLDWEVGQIILKLNELGNADNTLIMFASDNGPHSAGGNKVEWFDSNGKLRGGKRDLYEGGVRVPMIAAWPGKIAHGSETNHMSAFWDVLPTLCDLVEIDPPDDIDGISFLPTLLGKQEQQKQHDYLYWEFYEKGGRRAAMTHDWKAVQLNMKKGGKNIMLFNLDADLEEQNDVSAANPKIVEEFKKIFKEAHTPSPLVSWKK